MMHIEGTSALGIFTFLSTPRHDHLSGGKMEKLNLSVSLRLTTQRGIFLQNHFLRPTLAPKTFPSDLIRGLHTIHDCAWSSSYLKHGIQGKRKKNFSSSCRSNDPTSIIHALMAVGRSRGTFIIWKVARVEYNWPAKSLLPKWGPLSPRLLRQLR